MAESSSDQFAEEEFLPKDLSAGSMICGRFRVESHLGSGTAGHALLCWDVIADERVVCKVAKKEAMVETLVRDEYFTLRRLLSPALPVAIGFHLHNGAWPVLVVDYAQGSPLNSWVIGKSVRQRLEALTQLAVALSMIEELRRSGHGDLWSPNVIVSDSGRVRLIDPDGDSLGRSSQMPTGTAVLDLSGFQNLLTEFIEPLDRQVLSGLKSRLASAAPAPAFSEIAAHLRSVLRNPLPVELIDTSWTESVVEDYEARASLFRTIRERRDLEFRALNARVEVLLSKLRCIPLDANPTTDLFETEAKADSDPKGVLWHRTRHFRSPDGEEFWVAFNGPGKFRKPWPFPERVGLLSDGAVNVLSEGKLITGDKLEIWLRDGETSLWAAEGNRLIPFTQERLERLARILGGVEWPAFEGPYHNPNQHGRFVNPLNFRRLFENLGIPLSVESFPRDLLRAILARPSGRDLTGAIRDGEFGCMLCKLFEVPQERRLALVRSIGEAVIRLAGDCFTSIYRLDVCEVDRGNRRIRVLFEGRVPVQNDVSWTFEFTAPDTIAGMNFALQPAGVDSSPSTKGSGIGAPKKGEKASTARSKTGGRPRGTGKAKPRGSS